MPLRIYARIMRARIKVRQVKIVTIERTTIGYSLIIRNAFSSNSFSVAQSRLASGISVVPSLGMLFASTSTFLKPSLPTNPTAGYTPVMVVGVWHPSLFTLNLDVESELASVLLVPAG